MQAIAKLKTSDSMSFNEVSFAGPAMQSYEHFIEKPNFIVKKFIKSEINCLNHWNIDICISKNWIKQADRKTENAHFAENGVRIFVNGNFFVTLQRLIWRVWSRGFVPL